MGFFNKLRDIKDNVSYKLDDMKDFVVDKASDTKDFISDKTFDARYFISDKADDIKYFVSDKASDTKDFISDKSFDARYFIKDKVEDARYFIDDKAYDAKYFITEKLNIKSKADIVEATSYVLFPAQIPIKAVMSAVAKNSANSVHERNDTLNSRIQLLEKYQKEGKLLNEHLNTHLEEISKVKATIHQQLEVFSQAFEQIHNRPTYKLQLDGVSMTFDELFQHSGIDSEFAKFDSYLLKIYDEDAGIIDGLMRSPLFAAILKFREKALKEKIENALAEVNACIKNMEIVNQYFHDLDSTAEMFEKELKIIEKEFWILVLSLSELVKEKTDFEEFSKEEIMLLDTNIKFVRVVVNLLNTHLFEQAEPDANGLTPINKDGVKKVIVESSGVLQTL